MQQGGQSPLVAIPGPAGLSDCTPKPEQLFLTRGKDVAGISKVSPPKNMTALTQTEYLRLVKNVLQSTREHFSPPQTHFEELPKNSEHGQYFSPVGELLV